MPTMTSHQNKFATLIHEGRLSTGGDNTYGIAGYMAQSGYVPAKIPHDGDIKDYDGIMSIYCGDGMELSVAIGQDDDAVTLHDGTGKTITIPAWCITMVAGGLLALDMAIDEQHEHPEA